MASGYLTDLQIKAAEDGNSQSLAEVYANERNATSAPKAPTKEELKAAADEKARKIAEAKKFAEEHLSPEELDNIASRKRQLQTAEENRPKSVVERGRNALRLLIGGGQ